MQQNPRTHVSAYWQKPGHRQNQANQPHRPPDDSGAKQEVCSAPPQEVPREGLIEQRGTIEAEPLECWDLL